jgi:hypothetical protein
VNIYLHPEMTITEMNLAFQAEFPFLKLECFTRPHHAFQGSRAQYMIKDHQTRLGLLHPGFKAGELPIHKVETVRDLESLLEEKFGLFVQVFRKSHDVWLATSTTDNLTLKEQNLRGKQAEHPVESIQEPIDYREQD